MKGSEEFKRVIENFITKKAETDPFFTPKFQNENKSIDGCVNYILHTVKKSNENGFADEEIFGMAIHYYDEKDIKDPGSIGGRVVVNHKTTTVTKKPKVDNQQGSLFG